MNKASLFDQRVCKVKPHIIFLTETKLGPADLTSDYFNIEGFTAYRKDRIAIGDGPGGGIIILVKDTIVSEQIHNPIWEHIEMITCILRFGGKSVLASCVYRPPSSTYRYSHKVSEAIEVLSDISADQYLICGDFNYLKIDWLNHVIA